ncbi:hypothetical protein N9L68_01515 [bacterium]|nr:hypothetical protein [bacterium]
MDRVVVVATDQFADKAALARVRAALFRFRLDLGGGSEEEKQVFIGLCFGRVSCRLPVRVERLWLLRLAIKEVIRLRRVSRDAFRCLLGHATWAGMARRECLSIFAVVYALIEKVGARLLPTWPSVTTEIRWVSSAPP